MPKPKRSRIAVIFIGASFVALTSRLSADTITLKTGVVLKGAVGKDNTTWMIDDGLRHIILRSTKVAKVEPDQGRRGFDYFQLVQPLKVQAGAMPDAALNVEASEWDKNGRRTFSYLAARGAHTSRVTMTQALTELDPTKVKYRGVDGFWKDGQVAISQVPRSVVLGLLGASISKTCRNVRRSADS